MKRWVRKLPALFLGFLCVGTAANSEPVSCGCWRPTDEQISALESRVSEKLPLKAVSQYVRAYAGVTTISGPFVRAQYVPLEKGRKSTVTVISDRVPEPLKGEGCVGWAKIGSDNLRIICARPGSWLPSALQIAELERKIVMPRDAKPLQEYGRFYAGVTDNGRRVIRGVFSIQEPAGVQIASEAELPVVFDGGCGIVNLRADPDSLEATPRCNGVA